VTMAGRRKRACTGSGENKSVEAGAGAVGVWRRGAQGA
jgi:hypothetical protein